MGDSDSDYYPVIFALNYSLLRNNSVINIDLYLSDNYEN